MLQEQYLRSAAQSKYAMPLSIWKAKCPEDSGLETHNLFSDICLFLKTVTSLRRCQILYLAEKLGYPFDVSAGRSPEGGDLWGGSQCIGPYLKRMLKAHLFELDKDYIIRDQNIVILSPNTGRTQERSRWSDGVHQVTVETQKAILSYLGINAAINELWKLSHNGFSSYTPQT